VTPDQVGGIASTEVCDISCVMCHFNGPLAPRKSATITPEEGLAFMRTIPKGLLYALKAYRLKRDSDPDLVSIEAPGVKSPT
jgi:hypothetical protein